MVKRSLMIGLTIILTVAALFVGISYAQANSQVTATVKVLPPYPHNTKLTINSSNFFFYGSLIDRASETGIPYRPVRLTVNYFYRGALRRVVIGTFTFAGGSWFVPFNGDWKTAKIEFLGDSQYRPSSVTIKRT